jgi:hypothetical protein
MVPDWPDWAREAACAVQAAPSGANKQPWVARMDDDSLVLGLVESTTYWTRGYDMGIAALHAQLGALRAGVPTTACLDDVEGAIATISPT